jgi:hypothetical protein
MMPAHHAKSSLLAVARHTNQVSQSFASETSLLARAGNSEAIVTSMKRRLPNESIRAFVALLAQSAAARRAGSSSK